MNVGQYHVGMIVTHPKKPEWGPGKIQAVKENQLVVYFRDLREQKPGDAQKTLSLDYVQLDIAPVQSDPWLDNLPPYEEGQAPPKAIRLTMAEGIERFLDRFPAGFGDKKYLNDPNFGERQYKWEAHVSFVESLGNGQFGRLLSRKRHDELVVRVLAVESRVNLLSIYEKAAFRDALKDQRAASAYLQTLSQLLKAGPSEGACSAYFEATNNLPAEVGKSRVATWPVATIMPYLAQPDVFMFLKPEVTRKCAERLNFNLCYDARPNWLTYSKLLAMCDVLMEYLKPYGARDMIDLQSFIWCIEIEPDSGL